MGRRLLTARQDISVLLLVCGIILFLVGPAKAQYTSVWGDEFSGAAGSAPDSTKWTYDIGNNFGTGEVDYGTNSRANSYMDGNGNLVIAALDGGATANPEYTSAHVKGAGLITAGPYGQIEANIKTAGTDGLISAFWALGNNYVSGGIPWPYCGEIDIIEELGRTPSVAYGTMHGYGYDYVGIGNTYTLPGGAQFQNGYHTYGIYWMPYHIQWYVDGNIYNDLDVTDVTCYSMWAFNQPIFLIDDVGVGGTFAGPVDSTTVFPQYSYTNYIHVNKYTAGPPAAPSNLTGSATSNAVTLNWTASATAGVTYNVYANTTNTFTPGDLGTLVEYNVSGTSFTAYNLQPSTQYYFAVCADNPGGESAFTNVYSATTQALGNASPIHINVGGYGVGVYMKDIPYVVGGSVNNHAYLAPITTGVTNAAPAAVYKTERWGPCTYTLTGLNPGAGYTVRLHMIETVYTATGLREFDAYLNGGQILNNFDIFGATGLLNKALVKDFPAYADENGVITLDMALGLVDDPTISGLEVLPNSSPGLPSSPTNLTATATSTSNVNLSWTASSTGGVTYNVYRGNDRYFASSMASLVASNISATNYTDTVPFAGMTYYYRVAAVNATGESARSNVAGATTANQASNLVIAINAGGTATGTFAADQMWGGQTWTTSTTGTINTSAVTNPAPQAVYQSERYGNVTYSLAGLTAGATYKIRLHNCENYWTAAAQRQFNVSINGTQVLTNFDVYATAGAALKAVINEFNATADSLGHITIAFAQGAHDWPTIKGIEVYYVSGATLGAPTGVSATGGNGQVAVGWTGVSGAASYNLYRSTTSSGEGSTPVVSGIAGTSYTNMGLTNGTKYFYTVAAVNGANVSAQSAEVSATPTAGGSAPAVPAGLTAIGGNAQVALSWGASTGATSYNVYRGTSAGGEGASPVVAGITATSYTNTGLTNGTAYYFKVAAVNANGTSNQSGEANATPAAPAEQPYGGTAVSLPGTVQTENYDTGGQNVAFSVGAVNGTANSYRSDGVDIETTADTGGGYDMGWSAAAQWFRYTVNATSAGTYIIGLRVASPTAITDALHVSNSSGTNLSGTVSVPATGGYQTWSTVNVNVNLPAGQQVLTINQDAAGWNLNYMTFTLVSAPVISINCGGAAASPFVADTDFTGGAAASVTNTIDTSLLTGSIPPQAVLQSNRYNAPVYTIGGMTAGSQHTVTLYFDEGYWTAAGKRLMNVSINGTPVLTNFDIYATAGAEFKAVQRSFTATVNSSGQIVITLTNITDNAQINGIAVN